MTERARPPVRAPLVFVEDLDAPSLDPHDDHHLRRVLRVRDGDDITIADGAGRWRDATFGDHVRATSDVRAEPEPTPPITIAFALVKGDRPEYVVQKLTELGIDRIAPFVAARSVVRWDDTKAERNVERLRKVAREAAMQSRRARVPIVEPVSRFRDLATLGAVSLADFDGASPTLEQPIIAIGPEGGWTDEERAAVPSRVVLSAHVLRAETAAITAGALLGALRSGVANAVTRDITGG
jgi:16S rRNA (uracil1498-N3)-methyltransferase